MCAENSSQNLKKIATLSFQHAFNYGAVFQVAALRHVIEKLGAECDIIDYRCPAIDNQYSFRPIRINRLLFANIRANLVLLPFIKTKKRNFSQWMGNYKKTEVLNKEQLHTLNNRYDKFIVGSDQVWNLKCQGHDSAFFLDFVEDETKRVAYAASFGTFDVEKEDEKFYNEYIARFSAISVRETRGIDLVKSLANKTAVTCMDPVLLVGREYWVSKSDCRNLPHHDYIFVYQLGHGGHLPSYVKDLKRATKLKVIYVTGHLGNMFHYSFCDKNESSVSPERFLALLSHAKYVVTNSFHASVLSILFERQFLVVSKGGEKATYNTRIYNLLADYNLTDCIVEDFCHSHMNIQRNYKDVFRLLEQTADQSLSFIKNSLNI